MYTPRAMVPQITSGLKSRLMAMLCLAVLFSLTWGALAEAMECVQEPVVFAAEFSHAEGSGDDSNDSKSAENACVHGHCHHTAPAVSHNRMGNEFVMPARIFSVRSSAYLQGRNDEGLSRPPRI